MGYTDSNTAKHSKHLKLAWILTQNLVSVRVPSTQETFQNYTVHAFLRTNLFQTYSVIKLTISQIHVYNPHDIKPRCATEAFHTTCAVRHVEDCEGWWLSGCSGSEAKHWRLKPEVSWVRLPATAGLFTFLYFRFITSKFIYFQR